jgi:hypothetical protein
MVDSDESARSQFRSGPLASVKAPPDLGYASSLAKATVLRLLATPHLPVSDPLPNSALAARTVTRNRPCQCPADFLPPSQLPF